MKRALFLLALAGLVLPCLSAAETVLLEGHRAGQPTMDLDAALAVARAEKKAVFLDFTGSDWCGWCQLMQRNVFTKAAWQDYAKKNLVLVTIDFPNDQSIVPQRFRERNRKLQGQYGVEGYPTYVILDSDGSTELGRTGAGQEKTPASFIQEITKLLRSADSALGAFESRIASADKAEYRRLLTKARELRAKPARERESVAEELESILTSLSSLQNRTLAALLKPADKSRYDGAVVRRDQAINELNAWLATGPRNTAENQTRYRSYLGRIDTAEAEIETLLATVR